MNAPTSAEAAKRRGYRACVFTASEKPYTSHPPSAADADADEDEDDDARSATEEGDISNILYNSFQHQIAPLYPLLPPELFLPSHTPSLTTTEYLLLGTTITISARYALSPLLSLVRQATIHSLLAGWLRREIAYIYDGSPVVLSDWRKSWVSTIQHTTRLQTRTLPPGYSNELSAPGSSVTTQTDTSETDMSSQWWEKVCRIASDNFYARGFKDEWAEPMPQGFIASLIGTIQDRLYPNREITRASLKTGYWEGFLRSLSHELQHMKRSSESILKQGNIASTLLLIELDYLLLYANTIALRALQARSQRRVKANDIFSISATLLNLQEGPWVIESIAAAQSILRSTVEILHSQGHLRLAPARIFQRIVFAATFLFKSLAVGVVEHGQGNVLQLLDSTILALEQASLDQEHICSAFAALLRRLQGQYNQPTGIPTSTPTPTTAPTSTSTLPFATNEEYSPFESLAAAGKNDGGGGGMAHAPPFQWMPDRNLMAVGEQQDVLFHSLWAQGYSSNTSLIETLCGDGDFGADFGMQF
ncbi:hypothetical protein RQP46_002399 [Phenoliferia psychrophenolica]